MRDFLELLWVSTVVIGLTIAMLAPLALGIGYLINSHAEKQCVTYQRITGKRTQYIRGDICYVETASGWKRWDEIVAPVQVAE